MSGSLLWRVLGTSATQVVHECRTCGVSVAADSSECPDCGRTGIARYEISTTVP